MNERVKFEGHLKVNEDKARMIRLRIEGLRDSIRDILDPLEDIADLKLDVAYEQMVELVGMWAEYKESLSKIAAAKKALGRL